jgi:pimeloyl-ACP methyl ester carboxylesterase
MQIEAHGIRLEVDDQGPPDSPGGPPIVMIMGLGMQLVAWPEPLVRRLVAAGRRVIRFDNRDAGLSEGFDHLGVPSFGRVMMRYFLHLPVPAPYTIADMAADTLGLMEALRLPRAHVVGASMGGMIAQHLAAKHPDRVARLTLMMTTSGARHLPQPSTRVRMALIDRRHAADDIEGLVDHFESVMRMIGSPANRPDRETLRQRLRALVTRAFRPAGTVRQVVAVVADGDRSPLLGRIVAPTRIVHGAADPLVPVAAAHDLAAKIAGAELEVIEGMGHDLPEALWPRLAEAILRP